MSEITVNDKPVVTGQITIARVGAWYADLVVDSATEITGRVTISSTGFNAVGTVTRGELRSGRVELRIAGGGGGLAKVLTPKSYKNTSLSLPLSDLCREVGETPSPTIAQDVNNSLLPSWVIAASPATHEVGALADTLGVNWRILLDGTLWLGRETWQASRLRDYEVMTEKPAQRIAEIATDTIRSELLPGMMFLGKRVSSIEWQIDEDKLRAYVGFEREGAFTDALKEAFQRFVERVMWRTKYHALYAGRVVVQDANGLLDVALDDVSLPGLTKLPILGAFPGAVVRVVAGTRCLVGWSGGDPTKPYVLLWEANATQAREVNIRASEKILLGDNATKGVVRLGDHTNNGSLAFSQGLTLSSLRITYTPHNGTPQVVDISFASSSPVTVDLAPGAHVDLTGENVEASNKTLIE